MLPSAAFTNEVARRTLTLSSTEAKNTFSPSPSWGKQTSSFCWCQRYVWHTTACLRKQHWKDQCVFCYLGLSDRTTRVVVRSCLVMMHRLCAAVCCHSASVSVCTGRATTLQRGTWTTRHHNIHNWALIQFYHSSPFSRIFNAVMIWYHNTAIRSSVVRANSFVTFWQRKVWNIFPK